MKLNNKGFTLLELMISSSIGLFILSAVMYLMIQAFSVVRDSFADYYLAAQGRVLREKLLRNIDGRNGMRVAMWGDTLTVVYQNKYAEKMNYNYLNVSSSEWPDVNNFERVLIRRRNAQVAYKSTIDGTFKFPLKDRIVVQDMFHKFYDRNDITCEPRHIFSEYYLKIFIDGVAYDQFYYVKTVIVNDENN